MAAIDWIFRTILIQSILFPRATTFLRVDALSFNIPTPPKTNFSCLNKAAGFYADTTSKCKIYHTCDEYGNKFTYHCPEETAFRQDALICDHAHLVRCFGRDSTNATKFDETNKRKLNSTCVVDDSLKEGTNLNASRSNKEENKIMRFGFSFNSRDALKNFTNANNNNNNKGNVGKFYETNFSRNLNGNKFYSSNGNANIVANSSRIVLDANGNGNKFYNANLNNYATGLRKTTRNDSSQRETLNDKMLVINEKQSTNDQKSNEAKNNNNNNNNFSKFSLSNSFTRRIEAKTETANNPTIDFTGKFGSNGQRDFPYLETLKSIQKNVKIATRTTELPVYALTLSLKPLIPNELEFDPYYPKVSTTTEAYYTPINNNNDWSKVEDSTKSSKPVKFEFPSVLPDLNSLEDIVDRRKLLYIPRIKYSH